MTTTETYVHAPLKIADRCDTRNCGAQAFVRTHHSAGPLDWCGHHFARNELVLVAAGAEIQDERHRINEKPTPSGGPED